MFNFQGLGATYKHVVQVSTRASCTSRPLIALRDTLCFRVPWIDPRVDKIAFSSSLRTWSWVGGEQFGRNQLFLVPYGNACVERPSFRRCTMHAGGESSDFFLKLGEVSENVGSMETCRSEETRQLLGGCKEWFFSGISENNCTVFVIVAVTVTTFPHSQQRPQDPQGKRGSTCSLLITHSFTGEYTRTCFLCAQHSSKTIQTSLWPPSPRHPSSLMARVTSLVDWPLSSPSKSCPARRSSS